MLNRQDFGEYFSAIHGYPPFKWQERLLSWVLDQGWGATISLPTASGKTSVLDIAVFALALEAHLPAVQRRTPRRICLVVDRRIVVDDAFGRAQRIAHALRNPAHDVLKRVASALQTLDGERPLDVALLRGGIYREDRWARTPLQPVIVCSTVDQVGSRLLHRGYGLSPRTWPIHAGLLGHDALIILDEAHCSQPFLQTLDAISTLRTRAERSLPGPWAFVAMSATPRGGEPPFALNVEERAEAPIARRLCASKPARLIVAKRKGDDGIADEVCAALTVGPKSPLPKAGATVLVVLNRVKAARMVQARLLGLKSDDGASLYDVLLLTGRSRPVERDGVLAEYMPRLKTGRQRQTVGRPLVVVATQCIEVGADIDVDFLITEAAPLDSLRQRFGRLDRIGDLGRSVAMIICRRELEGDRKESKLPKELDPVYGAALTYCWWWLTGVAKQGEVDFGIDALDRCLVENPPGDHVTALAPAAPLLLPAYCDLWVQTGPEPALAPDPAAFLHGLGSAPAEVGIVWRADLDPQRPETWADVIAVAPPVAGEVLPLPLHSARAWLLGEEVDAGADQEGEPEGSELAPSNGSSRAALDWRGAADSRVVRSDALRPGSTLVVPCAWGGVDRMGWTGDRGTPATDVMEAALLAARRPALLRLHPGRALGSAQDDPPPGWAEVASIGSDAGLPPERELRGDIAQRLAAWTDARLDPSVGATVKALREDGVRIRVQAHPSGLGLVVSSRKRLAPEGLDFSDEDDLSSLAAQGAIPLDDHLRDVAFHAERNARGVGLPADLIRVLRCSASLHDLGKADPRFHAWMLGGDWSRVDPEVPLAKSDRVRSGQASERARRIAGYPQGGRHELLSVRLAESSSGVLPDEPLARDLALHLVASHHGHCRPWAPVIQDLRPIEVTYRHEGTLLRANSETLLHRIDSGVAERFWRLTRLYGWWGLSYLEACLRLADHRASEKPGVTDHGTES